MDLRISIFFFVCGFSYISGWRYVYLAVVFILIILLDIFISIKLFFLTAVDLPYVFWP